MLTFEDLQVAKLVREQKLVPAEVLPQIIADLDRVPGTPGLALRLLDQKLVDAEAMRTVVGTARRRVGLEADKVYTEIALAKHKIDPEKLESLMTKTMVGGRIGSKLVAEGILTAEQDAAVIAIARSKLQAREKELLAAEKEQITTEILSEPTIQIHGPQVQVPKKEKGLESSGAIRIQEEAILSEPTLQLKKEELSRVNPPTGDLALTPVEGTPLRFKDEVDAEKAKATSSSDDPEKTRPKKTKPVGEEKPLALADDTLHHSSVLPLPGTESAEGEAKDADGTEKHSAVIPIPGGAKPNKATGTVPYVAPDKPKKKSLEGTKLTVISGYEIEKELGRGAMGVVYLARETQLKRQVALKVLPKGDNEAAQQRFMREARAIAALDHPGIVPVYQYGEAEGDYYIAMKCIDGKPLKQLAQKPLQPKRAAAIMEPVARAMHYAHEQGVVHRDLKPANILVEAGDKPWVVDFGIAKLDTEMTMTQAGEIMGTPAYMSPEQALQMPLDARTDVYSLGAVLYAIVCGQPPFPGQNAIEVLPRVATEDPKKPSEIRPDIPRDLETIILVAMMKEPERRYKSAHELAEDLKHFTAGEPIAGQRPGAVYLARRWVKRRKLPLAVLAAALVFSFGAWSLRDSKAEDDKAKQAALQREEERKRVKAKLDGIEAVFDEVKKANGEELVRKIKELNSLLDAGDQIAKGNERVAAWRGELEKLVVDKANERRTAARKAFDEGSGERATSILKEAVALQPGAPENKALEELFKRPLMTMRWKTPNTQLVWARLDNDLHLSSDWQSPLDRTPERAIIAAPEVRFIRIKTGVAGRLDMQLDVEVKPGFAFELPQSPLATEDTKTMCFVPPVPHILGGRAKGAIRTSPEQKPLAAFLIDRTEVTRNAFASFVRARGYERREFWSERGRVWLDERIKAAPLTGPKDCDLTEVGRGEEPVTGVSFYEAEAYATFVGKQLPTQDQFEAASRGAAGGLYPWGNRYAKEAFAVPIPTPRAVAQALLDVSTVGAHDLGGNVREWTSEVKRDWASDQSGVVFHLVKGAFVGDAEADALQWAKGAACTARDPKERAPDIGFRCVKVLRPSDY